MPINLKGAMTFEDKYIEVIKRIPGVASPIGKLGFHAKLKWTAIMLFLYFVMGQVLVYGIKQESIPQLQFLEVVLGSQFGTLITLGIGPIVTASIILQLLVGSKLLPWDTHSEKGRTLFQGTQKILAFLFAVLEAAVFVSFGAIPAAEGAVLYVIIQLAIGGWIVLFMDEVVTKWGIGSGIGLFIVAGVSKNIILRIFNPLTSDKVLPISGESPVGLIPAAVMALGAGDISNAFLALIPVFSTLLVLLIVVYSSSIKVEVPLAFGSLRGFGRRWPLKFFYTSNMPVILVAALLANMQLVGRSLASRGFGFIGTFDSSGSPTGGLVYYLFAPNSQAIASLMVTMGIFVLVGLIAACLLKKNNLKMASLFAVLGILAWYGIFTSLGLSSLTFISGQEILRMITYSLFMIIGSMIFSIFWVSTSGMDAKSVSEQIESVGMYVAGHRRDPRIIEGVLNRYVPQLTIIGGAAIGLLAAYADFTLAIGTGTGILLAATIIYQLYEDISMRYADEMGPTLRKFFGKN